MKKTFIYPDGYSSVGDWTGRETELKVGEEIRTPLSMLDVRYRVKSIEGSTIKLEEIPNE